MALSPEERLVNQQGGVDMVLAGEVIELTATSKPIDAFRSSGPDVPAARRVKRPSRWQVIRSLAGPANTALPSRPWRWRRGR
jgi:hypothetical protein